MHFSQHGLPTAPVNKTLERSARHGKRGQEDEEGEDLSRKLRKEPPEEAEEAEGIFGFSVVPLPCRRPVLKER
jgi:hypothetical protein